LIICEKNEKCFSPFQRKKHLSVVSIYTSQAGKFDVLSINDNDKKE